MRYIRRRFPVRYRSSAKKKKRKWLAALLSGILALWLGISEWGLSSISEELTEEAARGYLLSCINQAVEEELENSGGAFVSVSRSGDGTVSAVSADAAELNRLRSAVLSRLSESANGKAAAYVPVGSLTGVGVLSGRGPKVPVMLKLEGSADVSFDTEFVSAGINQSCHRVTMTVRVRAYSQSKRFRTQVEEETSTVLAETVVIGQVPEVALSAG